MMIASFESVQGEQFPPEGWEPNQSLPEALIKAARNELPWWQWRKRRAVLTALNQLDYRFVLEAELTDMAMRVGAIPPEGDMYKTYGGVPIFVGAWTDIFDWIINNWPAIMEMIMQIISLFAAGKISYDKMVILLAAALSIGGMVA